MILIVGRVLSVLGISATQTLFHPYRSPIDFLFVLEVSPFCVYAVVTTDRIRISLLESRPVGLLSSPRSFIQ